MADFLSDSSHTGSGLSGEKAGPLLPRDAAGKILFEEIEPCRITHANVLLQWWESGSFIGGEETFKF